MNATIMHDVIVNLGPIIIAVTGVLIPVGGVARFIWNKIETRFTGIEAKLKECETRDKEKDEKVQTLAVCVTLLVPIVVSHDPASQTLRRVKSMLRDAFPPDQRLPPDIRDLLRQLHDHEVDL